MSATVHNPTRFEPADYTVVDYLDNKRPVYCGGSAAAYAEDVAQWVAEMTAVFGADYPRKIHRCVHCGNTNVRWITAVTHHPTGDVVVFGADCTERLGFENRAAWKLAQLKAKAAQGHARLKVWHQRVAFLEAHPEVVVALTQITEPVHAQNTFVKDVLRKLDQYGSLSPRQVEAVTASLAKDIERAAARAVEATEVKGEAPVGRATVTGVVRSVQDRETDFGVVTKLLLKLENNAKVWLTKPSGVIVDRGDTVTLTATFERSATDPSFGFGKRPRLVAYGPAAARVGD